MVSPAPGEKLPIGAQFSHEEGFVATVLEKDAEGAGLVAFATAKGESIVDVANRLGEVPLPPYIQRPEHTPTERIADLSRYQTVYADRGRQVAVAAPTAGLHFTPELITQLSNAGVKSADVTLHVGLGTFKPIATETIQAHSRFTANVTSFRSPPKKPSSALRRGAASRSELPRSVRWKITWPGMTRRFRLLGHTCGSPGCSFIHPARFGASTR